MPSVCFLQELLFVVFIAASYMKFIQMIYTVSCGLAAIRTDELHQVNARITTVGI